MRFITLLFLLVSCADAPKKNIAQNLEGSTIQINPRIDSLFSSVELIKIDGSTKCNLTNGYYYINNSISDSADLSLIAQVYAKQLFVTNQGDETCLSPAMAGAYIYKSLEDYHENEGNWLAMCVVDPAFPNGSISVATYRLKK